MALSDYLTSDEWDACFYASFGQHQSESFGASMHKTILTLISAGYEFSGLDEFGNKRETVGGGVNAPKVCIFLGNPHNVDVLQCLDNGRKFLKEQYPVLVDETDDEWALQMTAAKS